MTSFDWSMPYPSQRQPTFARNVVATSQPLAAQAGLSMLQKGGNAVDAAIATAIAMTVIEPTTNGIGSDAFALIWDPKANNNHGALLGLNASGRSPRSLNASHFAGMDKVPTRGWLPVTVPGAVAGWIDAHQKLGKLPFAELFEPAIHYARNGFPVAPLTAGLWTRAARSYRDFPDWGRMFLVNGEPPAIGQVMQLPGHARTLQRIADSNGDAFYKGELAHAMTSTAKAQGGHLALEDLAAHTSEWVEPLALDALGATLHEIPPNGQGIAAQIALGIMRHFDIASLQPDCPDVLHLQIEAMKLAFADAHRHVADASAMRIAPSDLLDAGYLESRAKLIDPSRSQDFAHGEPKPGGTILLCTADASGMMVSWIQSQYTGFGSGVVIPETGIAMQNRGACFTLEKGHVNEVAGGKRPYHTIIPGFVTASDGARSRPLMAFGVMGGFMQPQGHLQVFTRMFQYRQNPQAALDAPRWQVTTGRKVTIEPGYDAAVYEELRQRGHDLERAAERSVTFGRGQTIYNLGDNTYAAGSDLRADGHAVGW